MAVNEYMRGTDIDAFRAAAKFYKVWILVRASKEAARDYIGLEGYVPKRLDCKAKTADCDFCLPGFEEPKRTAGLVVNPLMDGMLGAFESVGRHQRAIEYWHKFEPLCYIPEPHYSLAYFPGGMLYSVQINRAHKHYGCVMFSSWSSAAAAKYIHSDYDLYGIVPADDPTMNVRVAETRLGQPHSRGRELFDIQHFLNRRMGIPMILHGEQEKYSDDQNDTLDVFWPDGSTVREARGAAAIWELYQSTFKGRQLYGPDAAPRPFFGSWQAI